ncbi:MAG: hypothetical protein KDD82_08180 [Planctomycetes bacterium]|nr:hypothetical protein [Planctomycetota bacterium]
MNKLIVACVLGVLCVPAAQAGLSSKKKKRIIARQKQLNAEWQQRFTSFVNVDAVPTFPSTASGLPSLGSNGFGLEVPSVSLPSPAASLRLPGLSPFGGTSFGSTLPGFNVGLPNLSPTSVMSGIPNLPSVGSLSGGAGLFGSKKGHHTSTSLPFLDTRDAGDLTYKIEAVKIAEAALKELKNSAPNSAGGFQMMKFLAKLIKSVGQRQKGLVGGMLVLITVPYFATLAASWWMGPTTAMDITWPGAKQGITTVIEQVLKKYGRIGGAMDIGSYATQLTQGVSHLASLPGQISSLPGQISSLPGQVSSLPGQISSLPGSVGSQLGGQLSTVGNGLGNLGSGLGNVPGINGNVNLGGQRLTQVIPPLR